MSLPSAPALLRQRLLLSLGRELEVMAQDARRMRGTRPFVLANLRSGEGVEQVIAFIREQGLLEERPAFAV